VHSCVVGIKSLSRVFVGRDGTEKSLGSALLAATTDDELRSELKHDIFSMLCMCKECVIIAKILGAGSVQDFARKLGRWRGREV
jgi:hypothetical protein